MTDPPDPSPNESARPVLRFVLVFAGSLVLFQLLFLSLIVESAALGHYLALCARITGQVLASLGQRIVVRGAELDIGASTFVVSPACSGLQPLAMLGIAMLAFPSTWRAKLPGLAAAVLVIGVLNLVRIASLCLIGAHLPGAFELSHLYLWPMALILCSIALWTAWARRLVKS